MEDQDVALLFPGTVMSVTHEKEMKYYLWSLNCPLIRLTLLRRSWRGLWKEEASREERTRSEIRHPEQKQA